jgi:hypothetical protein
MSNIVERDFFYRASGLRCVTLLLHVGRNPHRCGYVGIGKDHPLYGAQYNEPSPALKDGAEKVKNEPIGDRGIFTVFGAAFSGEDDYFTRPDAYFDVHGSITYSGFGNGYPVDSPETWWFGFDCSHCDDTPELWTEEAVAEETIRFARQLAALIKAEGK